MINVYFYKGGINKKRNFFTPNESEITFCKALNNSDAISKILKAIGKYKGIYSYNDYSSEIIVKRKISGMTTFNHLFKELNLSECLLKEIKCIEHYNQELNKLRKDKKTAEKLKDANKLFTGFNEPAKPLTYKFVGETGICIHFNKWPRPKWKIKNKESLYDNIHNIQQFSFLVWDNFDSSFVTNRVQCLPEEYDCHTYTFNTTEQLNEFLYLIGQHFPADFINIDDEKHQTENRTKSEEVQWVIPL